jgi:aspartate carbamoyltransferase catalytic subunit
MKHLLSIADLDQPAITHLLDRAEYFLNQVIKNETCETVLAGKVVANLFFEPSTRTQYSFVVAAERLGAIVLNPLMSHTSTVKGESLLDTVRTFIAMGTRILIIRHREERVPEWLAKEIGNQASIINGGDGCHHHPTQALLDLLTIRQYKKDFHHLKVSIVGDIAHSRVARSLIQGLKIMGCSQIRLIAPPEFLPDEVNTWGVDCFHDLSAGIKQADVIVALRIQLERFTLPPSTPEPAQFFEKFRLSTEQLRLAHPKAIVMHPGPMNRETEITSEVADGAQSVILQQITNGVAIRMAVMESLGVAIE